MAIISSSTLRSVPTGKVNRGKALPYLIYPNNMKGDDQTKGQDRIEFCIKEYSKETKKETLPNALGPENPNTDTPFAKTSVMDDAKYYTTSSINIDNQKIERVFLPIQDKIQDNNAVTWADGQLNDLQRRIANLSYNAMSGNDFNVDKSIDAMKSLIDDKSIGNLGRLALVEQLISVQGLFTRATGKILNPNLELLFSTPTLRPFTFNFKLSPRDEDEAKVVKQIIRFFKQGMAPRTQTNNLFLNSPFVFGIKYHYGSENKDHPGIGKIKTCALQSCFVDYTPNSYYMTYKDGTMVAYNMNLTFQEILPVYDRDYTGENEHPIGY